MTRDPDHKAERKRPDPGAMKTVVAQPPQPTASKTVGVLTVGSGPEAGRIVRVVSGEIVTLGRSDDCTVRFDDTSLSRVHARVMNVMDYMVGDAGSTNGTFVNGERIEKACHLEDGDRIQLGSGTTLRFSLVTEEEEAALRKIYEAAVLDGLTGVANRKHLEERLDSELAFALRHHVDLSVIIVDLDHFKRVNDTYGHLAGDAVLRRAAEIFRETVRLEDFVGRYGGEEFVVVARGTAAARAVKLAERLRAKIAEAPISFEARQIPVTMSAGVACLDEVSGVTDRASLLTRADERLYRAKEGGRNRVVGP